MHSDISSSLARACDVTSYTDDLSRRITALHQQLDQRRQQLQAREEALMAEMEELSRAAAELDADCAQRAGQPMAALLERPALELPAPPTPMLLVEEQLLWTQAQARETMYREVTQAQERLEGTLRSFERLLQERRAAMEQLIARQAAAPAPAIAEPLPEYQPATAAALPAVVDEAPQNRRRFERKNICAKVDFGTEHNFYSGFTLDMSEGGLFVATVDMLPIGTEVELMVDLPGSKAVRAVGQVRWHREYNDMTPQVEPGMGIQFLQVDQPDIIASFMSSREPLFYVD